LAQAILAQAPARMLPKSRIERVLVHGVLPKLARELVPQNLANLAWSIAVMKLTLGEPLRDSLSAAALRPLHEFGPQECALFAWSLA